MSDLISRQAVLDAVNDCGICIQKILDIPSAEPEEFEWCTDCKEYDQEKHCCHRWTKVIRQTVEEMKSAEPERKTDEWEEGEWIMHKMLSRDYGKIYYQHDCSCNLYESPYPFCPNCGMKMKRGDR